MAHDQKRLPAVERLESGKLVRVFLDEVSELIEKPGAFCAGRVGAPGGLEGFAGGEDGDIEVCFGTVGDAAYNLACTGVDYPGVVCAEK